MHRYFIKTDRKQSSPFDFFFSQDEDDERSTNIFFQSQEKVSSCVVIYSPSLTLQDRRLYWGVFRLTSRRQCLLQNKLKSSRARMWGFKEREKERERTNIVLSVLINVQSLGHNVNNVWRSIINNMCNDQNDSLEYERRL